MTKLWTEEELNPQLHSSGWHNETNGTIKVLMKLCHSVEEELEKWRTFLLDSFN